MTLLLVSDAWHPQVNGVVRTLDTTARRIRELGKPVELLTPDGFRTIGCPTYPEIRLTLVGYRQIAARLEALREGLTHIHIATEGPLGIMVRRWCLKNGFAFTTSFHTRFPDYVAMRTWIRADWIWPWLAKFHNAAARTMVATPRLASELEERGIEHTHHWPLGVDIDLFTPRGPGHPLVDALPRPVRLYVGRIAVEKNLTALLELEQPGSVVLVGGGPDLEKLKARYPTAHFLGPKHGEELAAIYRSADVFVFPSRTETFGLVMAEALACGTPVAAYPVQGPLDIVGREGRGVHGGQTPIGALDEDLGVAVARALMIDPEECVAEARFYGWGNCTRRFMAGLVPVHAGPNGGRGRKEPPPLAA